MALELTISNAESPWKFIQKCRIYGGLNIVRIKSLFLLIGTFFVNYHLSSGLTVLEDLRRGNEFSPASSFLLFLARSDWAFRRFSEVGLEGPSWPVLRYLNTYFLNTWINLHTEEHVKTPSIPKLNRRTKICHGKILSELCLIYLLNLQWWEFLICAVVGPFVLSPVTSSSSFWSAL